MSIGLSWNLQSAQRAVEYVKKSLPTGAGNQWQDKGRSNGASETCYKNLRAAYPDSINHGRQTTGWIKDVAKRAMGAGCGNCAEQCAVAITWLLEYSTATVEFVGFEPSAFDHQFVVIGRSLRSEITDISSWGPEAVVCDPWSPQLHSSPFGPAHTVANSRAYPADVAKSRMTMFLPAGEPYLMMLNRWEIH